MLDELKKRPKLHLMNLIGNRINGTPNFSILIGAGASYSSGVKSTGQIIKEWRKQLYKQSKSKKKFDDWFLEQNWYKDDEEYSILFEMLYDKPSQRRNFIEQCVKNAKPSWGYIYLANLIAENYFNVCFTPNFDDLLNEACCFYANIKPIVCAHDSVVADIRVTSKRPKIIKLHGDFLYDSIKNTISETETLEKNMRDKFSQFAREYGLIVIGYGGNDRSIMDILEMSAKSKDFFPQGIYWCIRKNDRTSRKLERLMRKENIFWVEIDGFDEFMAELHEDLGLTLPDAVRDPYAFTTKKLNNFISPMKNVDNPIIKKSIAELRNVVKRFEQIISGKGTIKEGERLVPYTFLASHELNQGNYQNAINYYNKALQNNPSNPNLMLKKVEAMNYEQKFKESIKLSNAIIKQFPNKYQGYFSKAHTLVYLKKYTRAITFYNKALKHTSEGSTERVDVLRARTNIYLLSGKWKKALSDADKILEGKITDDASILNRTLALKKLGNREEAFKIFEDYLTFENYPYFRACAHAGLEDKENMLKELETAIEQKRNNRIDAMRDPEFMEYHEDTDFKKLVQKKN